MLDTLKFLVPGLLLAALVSTSAMAEVQISGLGDFTFASLRPDTGNQQLNQDICVYNSDGINYRITITGSGTQQQFELTGAGTLPFQVFWNDMTGTMGNKEMTPNIPQQFTNASQTQFCPSGANANLQIQILASEIEKAVAGSYSGTLNILIEPV